jgi:hypothetical protein
MAQHKKEYSQNECSLTVVVPATESPGAATTPDLSQPYLFRLLILNHIITFDQLSSQKVR